MKPSLQKWCSLLSGLMAGVMVVGCSPSPNAVRGTEQSAARTETQKLFEVKVGGKFGFIDLTGKLAISPQFDKVGWFQEGRAWVCLGTCSEFDSKPGESKYGFINTSGKYVVGPTYDSVGSFSEGLAPVCTGDCRLPLSESTKWGYVDADGAVAIPLQFGGAFAFEEGLAAVCVGICGFDKTSHGKWGYINPKGSFVVNPQFDNVWNFENGLAKVEVGKGNEMKIAYINKTGDFVWSPAN